MKTKLQFIAILILCFTMGAIGQVWDDRPEMNFGYDYEQDYTGGALNADEQAKFNAQWGQIGAAFPASQFANGYLQFQWIGYRIIYSHSPYSAPFAVEGKIAYGPTANQNRAGLVLRVNATDDKLQEPPAGSPTQFNKEGIAFYPADADSMYIQFTATDDVTQTRVKVVKPAGAVDLLAAPFTIRVEDFDSSLYAFIDGKIFARIDLDTDQFDEASGIYPAGTVYDTTMTVLTTFSGMEVVRTGHVSFAQRDAVLRVYDAKIGRGGDRATVTFEVSDGTNDLSAATVLIDNKQVETDANGKVIIENLFVGSKEYSVYKLGFDAVFGTIELSTDGATLPIVMNSMEEPADVEFLSINNLDMSLISDWSAVESDFNAVFDAMNAITAADVVANSHIKMAWTHSRIIASKDIFVPPYSVDLDFGFVVPLGDGGIVIRHDPEVGLESMQEPGNISNIVPFFNQEGIAIFSERDGSALNIQFSGPLNGPNGHETYVERITVPVDGVNLRDRGVLSVEDYGEIISVMYNETLIAIIDLDDLVGDYYTSGAVYNNSMGFVGAFSDVEVIVAGKAGLALRATEYPEGTEVMNVFRLEAFAGVTAPEAPTSATAVAGNAEASVAFTAPASDGGSAITGYTVTSSPGGITATGTESPIIVTGLTNGTAYTFTVEATNVVGTSEASAASNEITPSSVTVPGIPTSVSALAGNASAEVSFTAPASDGGSVITGYTVISSPGAIEASGTASPITVTGLTNGTAYTFTVVATNAIGNSAASAASAAVTPEVPITVADAPTAVSAVAGDAQAEVSFTAPASDGGAAITFYTVTSSPEGINVSGTVSPITVTGLSNGTEYTFTVTATNSVGASAASAASNAVTPSTTPEMPTEVVAALGDTEATVVVTFTAPGSDGGSSITSYTVTSTPDGITQNGTSSPITISGLTSNTSYTFTVIATNVNGDSQASAASNEVTMPAGTSIKDLSSAEVNVYQRNLSIIVDMSELHGRQKVSVIDITGKTIISEEVTGGSEYMIASQMRKGLYIVTIQSEGEIYQNKIVVR